MPGRISSGGGLRRRLTIAFTLAVGASAAVLAAGSYVVVHHNLLADSVDSAVSQSRRNLEIAPGYLKKGGSPDDLLAAYQSQGDFDTVGVSRGLPFNSVFALGVRQVPNGLRQLVRKGQLGYARTTVTGKHYLVVGGPSGRDTELYYFFSEQDLRHELAQLRNILLVGVGILMLVAAFVGVALARSTLSPVARASDAARSLAEGLLETRLPVEGRDEFGVWAQSFNEMAAALEGKISALSAAQARERRFTADVAHELRTPLTALVGEASLLSEHLEQMPVESRRPAELLIADVGRLRRLVENLMAISRFDAGRESIQSETVDLGTLAAAAVRARGWDGRVRLDADDVVITSDPRRLEGIVANLVGNALEHGGDGVAVRVGRDGDGAFVEVADDGPGIAPEHLPHLFERFYKADPARSSGGTGLGLAIAQENARLLGGRIEVRSAPGQGARFTLRL
jgi:two-component system, OmpR family, sensor histidine kinase MtrB